MKTYALIGAAGLIVNRILLDDDADYELLEGHSLAEETTEPMEAGGTYIGGVYTPPPVVLPPIEQIDRVPAAISDRQFFQQLAINGVITTDEALAAVKTGDMPQAIQGFIDAMPAADRFGAQMLLSGATVFERAHPLSSAIGAATGRNEAQIDDFFRAAALL